MNLVAEVNNQQLSSEDIDIIQQSISMEVRKMLGKTEEFPNCLKKTMKNRKTC